MEKQYKELKVIWSRRENDFLISFPRSCDGSLINDYLFNNQSWYNGEVKKSLKEELENRGYDLETLRFSVKLKNKEVKQEAMQSQARHSSQA